MQSAQNLESQIHRLNETLKNINETLATDEFANPFELRIPNQIKEGQFNSPILSAVVHKCEMRNMGFDPNLFLQHLEHELLEQYNKIVLDELKGKSVEYLLRAKHELELFMLLDKKQWAEERLKAIQEEQAKTVLPEVKEEPKAIAPKSKTK